MSLAAIDMAEQNDVFDMSSESDDDVEVSEYADIEIDELERMMQEAIDSEDVITSYSIHYTKLYETYVNRFTIAVANIHPIFNIANNL